MVAKLSPGSEPLLIAGSGPRTPATTTEGPSDLRVSGLVAVYSAAALTLMWNAAESGGTAANEMHYRVEYAEGTASAGPAEEWQVVPGGSK